MVDVSANIIAKAASGDMEAFEKLYRATCDYVYNITLRMTNSREDAQEAAQDVFLKVHKNLRSFGFRSSFKTWIYRIAVNTAINMYKKRQKESNIHTGYDDAIESIDTKNITREEIDKKDAETLVASMLAALGPDHRACVVLRDIQGLSYKEIAAVLKVNINTVRSRLNRARQKLLELRKRGNIS